MWEFKISHVFRVDFVFDLFELHFICLSLLFIISKSSLDCLASFDRSFGNCIGCFIPDFSLLVAGDSASLDETQNGSAAEIHDAPVKNDFGYDSHLHIAGGSFAVHQGD